MNNRIEQAGCILLALLVCGPAALFGVALLWEASQDARESQAVAVMKPVSAWSEVEAARAGTRVLAVGRIAADTPVVESERGLVIFSREVCSRSYGRKGRVRVRWSTVEQERPGFVLTVRGAFLPIRGGAYALRRPTLDQPHVDEVCEAWHGFRAGDAVVVDGTATDRVVQAKVVFGGAQAAYAADLAGSSSSARTSAAWVFGAAALVGACAVLYVIARNRP